MDINAFFEHNQWAFYAGRALMLIGALLLAAWGFSGWRRDNRRDMRRMLDETRALSEVTQRLVAQLAAVEARIEDRGVTAVAATPAQRGYDFALQMARNGANPEDIVNASGVTRHEAQLLARLHNPALQSTAH